VNKRNLLVSRWGKTPLSPGTVSKALNGLQDDLIVDRSAGVRLLQVEKLLEKLGANYERPPINNRVRLKVDCDWKDLPRLVQAKGSTTTVPIVATGLGSVSRYAVMQREDILSVYCPRIEPLLKQLRGNENDRFPNCELIETDEQPVYFDAREEDGFFWASPVQTYLELATGDKRDRETAEQVRGYVLARLEGMPR